jgi:hypothetical protein
VQAECRGLGEHDAPEVDPTLTSSYLLLLLLVLTACRWVQAECRGLGEHDAPEVDPTLMSSYLLLLLLLLVLTACRWVQAECRSLGEHDAPEVDPTLASAVAALRDRPVLFKYCAEEVSTSQGPALGLACCAQQRLY